MQSEFKYDYILYRQALPSGGPVVSAGGSCGPVFSIAFWGGICTCIITSKYWLKSLCLLVKFVGLRNAAQTFQRFMDQVLRGVPAAYAYIDDVLIASPTHDQHLKDFQTVFERHVNPNKCLLGFTPLPDKVQAVREFPQPQSQRQLRRFHWTCELLPSFSTSLC